MDGNAKQDVAEKLRSSSSVLVTVSKDPSVDQLASALGLSLMLTKLGKHTTTVFSGDVPNTMEFLDPEKTFDKTVDGLRDFIISLDKEKADKLRYKVEDNVVKIFITPYKSKITEADLNYSQGDFNVDLVVALGVHDRNDLDQAITSHGRILHDATIVTINDGETGGKSSLGAVDWTNPQASCLSEMLVSISEALEGGILDNAMSTAFLTGIVSATDRFKNEKTTPKLMTMAAQLMAAGANQQLIASNLQLPDIPKQEEKPKKDKKKDDSSGEGKGGSHAKEDETMAIDRDEKPEEKQNQKEEKKDDSKSDEPKEDEPPKHDDGSREPEAKPVEPGDEDLLAEIEEAVHAKHNTLDEQGRTQKIDDEDPAIKQLEDDLSHDSSTNLLDLEGKLKDFDPQNVEQPANDPVPQEPPKPMQPEPPQPMPQQQPPAQQPQVQRQVMPMEDNGPIGQAKGLGGSALDEQDQPTFGATFNATAQEAHDRIEADRNRAINKQTLSHGAPGGAPSAAPTSRGKDLTPSGDAANNNVPSSEELMHDLQEARRAVEEAMMESSSGSSGPTPIQALNANPLEMDDGSGGSMNLSNNNMQQMNQPQGMNPMGQQGGGMQQGPQQPPPQFAPQMPPTQYQPGQQQSMPQNPMFNLPQPQQQASPQPGQQFPSNSPFGDGNGQMPSINNAPQQGPPPPPMPPNAPPPMPPFN